MKIISFEGFKDKINKLDSMAKVDMTRPNSVFPQNSDESISEKMKRFFDVADGNSIWNE